MAKVERELMIPAAYARRRGCSAQAVHRALRDGRITAGPDGRIDPVIADAQWTANSRVRVRSVPAPAAGTDAAPAAGEPRMSYDEARRRQAVADALMAERAELLQRRELVRVADLRMSMGRYLTAARDICLGTGARLAPLLAAEGDIAKCAALIDVEMRGVLHALVEADAKALQGEVPAP